MASVSLESVSKNFGTHTVIQNVDLQIIDGEFVVFVGPSGCGKSTLLRIVAGLISASNGVVRIGGDDVTDVPASQRGVAFVFQSYALYPHMNVARNIGFALETLGMNRAAISEKVRSVARMLKVDHLLERRPRELSGGQRQRVAIARALVLKPRFIVLDEPTSALDMSVQAQIVDLLRELQQRYGLAYLFISHDLKVVRAMAHDILVMKDGKIVESGPTDRVMDAPEHPYTKELMAAAFDLAAAPA
jgi:multiple sugar transport system ATP-binding protein